MRRRVCDQAYFASGRRAEREGNRGSASVSALLVKILSGRRRRGQSIHRFFIIINPIMLTVGSIGRSLLLTEAAA